METLTLRDFHIILEVLKLIGHYKENNKIISFTKEIDEEKNIIYNLMLSKNNIKIKYIFLITENTICCIIQDKYKYTLKLDNQKIDIYFGNYLLNTIPIKIESFKNNYLRKKRVFK